MNNQEQSELLFCQYHALLQSHREAALRAGYPPCCAEEQGLSLLSRPEIREEAARLASYSNAQRLAQVQAGLRRLAFGPTCDAVRLLYWEEAQGPPPRDLDLFCVSEIRRGKSGVEIRFFDRLKALELLARLPEQEQGDSGLLQALLAPSSDVHG